MTREGGARPPLPFQKQIPYRDGMYGLIFESAHALAGTLLCGGR